MPETDINSTEVGNLTNTETVYSVTQQELDVPGEQKETEYLNDNFPQQVGYYKSIPELKEALDTKAIWTVGSGFKTDPQTRFIIDGIRGYGKETFNKIIRGMMVVRDLGGDAFAEIIRDDEKNLINLKPLNPSTIKIIFNRQGIITAYKQLSRIKGLERKFKPEQIFHLSRNRLADEMHGISVIDALEKIILFRNESMEIQQVITRRYSKPRIVYKLDTDDTTKINEFKAKADKASDKGENVYIPLGAVEWELLAVPTNATLNPMPWIDRLNAYFFQVCGVPQIIVGGSGEITEATAKIVYLAFEQRIKANQLEIEEEIGMQLGLQVDYEFPASLENELLTDKSKSETMQASTPEDTTVQGVGVNDTQTRT